MSTVPIIKLVYDTSLSLTVVLLSENRNLCVALNRKGIRTETIKRAEMDPKCPVKILPAHYLTKFYSRLGEGDDVMVRSLYGGAMEVMM